MEIEIRKDFESAAPYLHRIWQLGTAFDEFEKRWIHLVNNEDFEKIYGYTTSLKNIYEKLYRDGREIAGYMSSHLQNFNSVRRYPSMSSYVDSFQSNWTSEIADLKEKSLTFSKQSNSHHSPWAVRRMIELWDEQVSLLEAVQASVKLLKQTDIYRIENGEIKLSELNKGILNVGVLGNVQNSQINVSSSKTPTAFPLQPTKSSMK